MCIWHEIFGIFWSPLFWLSKNITWADVAPGSHPNISHADYRDLLWSLPMAIVLFAIRYCCENYIFSTFGQWLGIKDTRSCKRLTPNQILEKAYKKYERLDETTMMGLTKQVDSMTSREIERWWRMRLAQDKPTTLRKFCESSWRCLYYACSFSLCLFVLWDKPWLWDVEYCWINHPHHSTDIGLWSYYVVSLSLYLSLLVSQFFDVKRKDFWLLFCHHIVAILIIVLTWISHFHRVGSLALLCHDIADIPMEAAKMAKYAKCQKSCDVFTAIFVFVWMISRMVFYPRLIYNALTGTSRFEIASPVSQILISLAVLLQCLHIVWTYMIFKIAYVALKRGAVKNDCRSSSESGQSSTELSDRGKCENHKKFV